MSLAPKKKEVSTSKFYMLRCVVAMAHADGIVTDVEIAYISGILNRLALSPEQRKTIDGDFSKAQKVEDLLPYINEPRFRGQAVDFARIMAWKDGVLHPSEEEMLKKLHAAAMDGIDMNELRKTVNAAVKKELGLHDIEVRKSGGAFRGNHAVPYFQAFDEFLLNNDIDLLKE